MPTPALTHTLGDQLECRKRTTPSTFRLFYFFLHNDYASNDNVHYIHRRTIRWDDPCHCQTHQDYQGERSVNSIPHEQDWGIDTKYN